LVAEGHDSFLSRRALAFAEMNVDDARAILLADQMDAEEEAEEARKMQAEKEEPPPPPLKTVTVNTDFDPTAGMAVPLQQQQRPQQQAPKPAQKKDVVFEANAAEVQQLVLESPVPVLLDIYADWCGPCKTLGPVLEEMAVKAGGMFRLVKINSDNERAVSGALEVTALPTVFGVKDGKIVHMFQGMPRGEEGMKNFMMGLLMPGASFDPPVSAEEKKKYAALSSKLAKTAGAASFSFSARERLQDRTAARLDQLVDLCGGNMADAEDSAKVIRSLLSNVIRDPFETKYRRVNLQNKVLAAKVAAFSPCISILKSVGFVAESDGSAMMLGKNKKVVNVAPVTVARDCIDKWMDKNRQEIAAASRKRRDDIERQRLAEDAAAASDKEEEHQEEEEVDPDAVLIKMRVEGKKKVSDLVLRADDPLSRILESLSEKADDDQEIQLTCVAKRLVVKSSDEVAMSNSLREHGLVPTASIVVKIGNGSGTESSSSLKDRAAAHKNRKKGSHTMQTVGIYGKDDNAKGELVDGGGGVMYEQDVSDDEEEPVEADQQSEGKDDEPEEPEA
jgi:thioredoxin-like negative regulator of GroEL